MGGIRFIVCAFTGLIAFTRQVFKGILRSTGGAFFIGFSGWGRVSAVWRSVCIWLLGSFSLLIILRLFVVLAFTLPRALIAGLITFLSSLLAIILTIIFTFTFAFILTFVLAFTFILTGLLAGDKKATATDGVRWVLPQKVGLMDLDGRVTAAEIMKWLD